MRQPGQLWFQHKLNALKFQENQAVQSVIGPVLPLPIRQFQHDSRHFPLVFGHGGHPRGAKVQYFISIYFPAILGET